MMEYQDILSYWFGDYSTDLEVMENRSKLWWRKDAETDEHIRNTFMPLLAELDQGRLDSWKSSPEGRLAIILLIDQFCRNMFRGQAEAFKRDPVALGLALEGLEQGMDKQLSWTRRIFWYMPLEHSESLQHQQRSVDLFRQLAEDVPGEEQDKVYGYIDFAIQHWDIINRFGRFPHRNHILGRESTAEELEFLKQPGSSF